jgi:hypothetical protein
LALVRARKDGKAFHRLVHAIESAIARGDANIRVETSKRIPDKVTGVPREHDVVLTIAREHHELVIALECRDLSRKIDVKAVEAFHSKCEHTGINSGIIVSARGFYKPAIAKATHYDIRCLTLEEAESFDWCPASGVETFLREIRGSLTTVLFPGDGIKVETIHLEDGTPLTEDITRSWAENALNQHDFPPGQTAGDHRVIFRELKPKLYGIRDGERVQADAVLLELHFTVSVGFAAFSFRTYMDMGLSRQLKQVAMCAVQVGDVEADLVLSRNKEGLITAALVSSPPALAGPSEKGGGDGSPQRSRAPAALDAKPWAKHPKNLLARRTAKR